MFIPQFTHFDSIIKNIYLYCVDQTLLIYLICLSNAHIFFQTCASVFKTSANPLLRESYRSDSLKVQMLRVSRTLPSEDSPCKGFRSFCCSQRRRCLRQHDRMLVLHALSNSVFLSELNSHFSYRVLLKTPKSYH